MTERLLRDVFNAEVYAPDVGPGPQQRTRVFVTTHRVMVWRTDANNVPEQYMEAAITGEPPMGARDSLQGQLTIETDKGVVHVTRGRGCGCGSSLRALDPPVTW